MSLRDESKENEELFEAVWDGDAYLIEDLIEAGADPDAVDGDMEYYYGQTPLTIATDHNDLECAEVLLEKRSFCKYARWARDLSSQKRHRKAKHEDD